MSSSKLGPHQHSRKSRKAYAPSKAKNRAAKFEKIIARLRGGATPRLHMIKSPKGAAALYTIDFGDAFLTTNVNYAKASKATLEQSQRAMTELAKRVKTPGVKLPPTRAGVPMFYVDEANPARIVRELDGKREIGVFEAGQFKATA